MYLIDPVSSLEWNLGTQILMENPDNWHIFAAWLQVLKCYEGRGVIYEEPGGLTHLLPTSAIKGSWKCLSCALESSRKFWI